MKTTLIILAVVVVVAGIWFYAFKKDAAGLTYKQRLDANANKV